MHVYIYMRVWVCARAFVKEKIEWERVTATSLLLLQIILLLMIKSNGARNRI